MYKSNMRIAVALLAACTAFASIARAEEGTVDIALIGVRNLTSVVVGDTTVTAGGATGGITVTRSSGAPFVEDVSGTTQCINFSKKSETRFDLEADCLATFTQADTLQFQFRRESGDLSAGTSARGVQKILGGTGRFAGIVGDCTYKVDNLPNNWNATLSKCRWHK